MLTTVKLSLKENVEGNTKAVAEINSEDIGTNYKYYVEAMAKSNANNNTSSNIVESTALSGIKGYVVSVNENPNKMPELIQYEEDGKTVSSVISAKKLPDYCQKSVIFTCFSLKSTILDLSESL